MRISYKTIGSSFYVFLGTVFFYGFSVIVTACYVDDGIESETSSSADETDDADNDDETGSDAGSNADVGSDMDAEKEVLIDGTFVDKERGLQWENPLTEANSDALYKRAKTYCENLLLADMNDWRVPTVDEARTLIEGVSTTMEGGLCPTSEECFNWVGCNTGAKVKDACEGCADIAAKHLNENDCTRDVEAGECYWLKALKGPCRAYWTSTKTGVPTGRYSVLYSSGYIRPCVESSSKQRIRCVRDYR